MSVTSVRAERIGTVSELISSHGADPRLRDAAGLTAFDHAGDDAELAAALSVECSPWPGDSLWFTSAAGEPAFLPEH